MSDFEGNVHQLGSDEDYEEGTGPPIGIALCLDDGCAYCGHAKSDHNEGCECNLCECINFEKVYEEVE